MKIKNFTIIILSLFLLIPFTSNGAVINKSIGGSVTFELSPKNPGSFENVKITANSFDIDLNRAYVSWYVDGKLMIEGPAQKKFNFQTGRSGVVTNISFLAVEDGKRVEKTMSINPADVEIIWEADTYVPSTYKGKALASPKSSVKIIAIPSFVSDNGNTIPKEELIYEWSNNLSKIGSGLGKDSAQITMGTPLGESIVSVKVSTQKKDIVAEKEIKIMPENVFIAFYEDKPLDGTNYNLALKETINFSDVENSLRAEPYYFSFPESLSEKNLTFNWTLNGKGITPNDGTPKIITLRNESGREVLSALSLTIKNIKKIFQESTINVFIKSRPGSFNF